MCLPVRILTCDGDGVLGTLGKATMGRYHGVWEGITHIHCADRPVRVRLNSIKAYDLG